MRTFHLDRSDTGITGIGIVAEGVQFSNGQCALLWKAGPPAVTVYRSLADLTEIQGTRTTLHIDRVIAAMPSKEALEAAYKAGLANSAGGPEFEAWYAKHVETGP